jgi:hypothetical protein
MRQQVKRQQGDKAIRKYGDEAIRQLNAHSVGEAL